VHLDGRLLDVLLDRNSIVLRDDDGSECVLETLNPREETRPSCDDLFDADWTQSVSEQLTNQRDFNEFFEQQNPQRSISPVQSIVVPPVVVPPIAPPITRPDPQPPSPIGDDDGDDDDDDDDD
jgi:hypothetical protein